MKELECPYCEHMNKVPEDCYDNDDNYERECAECGKTFGFTVEYYPHYTEYELPCANGEPHDYKPIIGCPQEYFIGQLRCSYCQNETTEEILAKKKAIK